MSEFAPDTGASTEVLLGLVHTLTLEQKVRLLTGADFWTTHSEPAIGLRAMLFSDGPSGVRGPVWDERDPSLNLPSATALAAAWDPELAYRYAAALAAEARRKNVDVVLGPTVNLHRSPLAGRHFEAFSEDPLLTGELAAAYVRGLQQHGVAATPKHYVANDAETDRFTVSVHVNERSLRELYLAPFETAVNAGAWCLMSAYNAVGGTTMTENHLLETPLCTEWGFDGVVVSDWTAVRSTDASARARQDLVMPGPDGPWGQQLVTAVRQDRVPEAAIDEKVLRLLRLAARVGALTDLPAAPSTAPPPIEAGPAVAREVAAAGTVLLQNTGELPWNPATPPRSIAVIGEHATHPRTQGGGSATVQPTHLTSPVDGLRAALPSSEITWARGVPIQTGLAPLPLEQLTDPESNEPGLRARFLTTDGTELLSENRRATHLVWLNTAPEGAAILELRTRYRPEQTGPLQLGAACVGHLSLTADRRALIDTELAAAGTDLGAALFEPPAATAATQATADTEIDLVVRYQLPDTAQSNRTLAITLGTDPADQSPEDSIAEAVAAARAADVAVVVVGTSPETESEGFDRTSLALPGAQDDLVRAVATANPRTIVVLNTGGPVLTPWREQTAALLLTWFGGQETGHALADVLLGHTEPGGRLPTTWPATQDNVPVLSTTPENGVLRYDEGLHIGYRAWLRSSAEPAYPFGHGLGYTTWQLTDLTVEPTSPAAPTTACVTVHNTGTRPGKQLIQAYLAFEGSTVQRPIRWLAAYTTVHAHPGTTQRIRITIPARAFAHWDNGWHTEPGTYTLLVGTNTNHLPLTTKIPITGHSW